MSSKKPPDKDNYKTLKVPLKSILDKNYSFFISNKINTSVTNCNVLVTRIYEFINLFTLYQFENNKEIPNFTLEFITKVTNFIGQKDSRGKKSKIDTKDDVYKFYSEIFSSIYPEKLQLTNLSYIIPLLALDIVKTIETNIKTHFPKYIRKLINTTFLRPYKVYIQDEAIPFSDEEKLILYAYLDSLKYDPVKYTFKKATLDERIQTKKLNREYRTVLYKNINKELNKVKDDFFSFKIDKSASKYHEFINKYLSLFPVVEVIGKTWLYDLKVNPQNYIKLAIQINKDISTTGRCYQVIPQRTSLVPRHIILSTNGLLEVINDKEKNIFSVGYTDMMHNTKKYQDYMWSTILVKTFTKKFKVKGYHFYNQISTDGFSASLLFIRADLYNKKYGTKLTEPKDFFIPYIEELNEEKLNKLKKLKLFVGIDPGHCDIITATDGSNTFYEYSNVRRRNDTYTKRSKEILLAEKKKTTVTIKETEFASICKENNFSRRSLEPTKYMDFLTAKNDFTSDLEITEFYKNILWRKLDFRRSVYTKSSEQILLNELEERYTKNAVLGLGDYSASRSLKGTMPVPGRSIYKLLTKRFEHVYLVDEFRTSVTYNRDHTKKLTNLKINNRSKHRLLTPKENPKGVIVNRDHNASINIRDILVTYIEKQERPNAFKRSPDEK